VHWRAPHFLKIILDLDLSLTQGQFSVQEEESNDSGIHIQEEVSRTDGVNSASLNLQGRCWAEQGPSVVTNLLALVNTNCPSQPAQKK
jgi:hypothetical protein